MIILQVSIHLCSTSSSFCVLKVPSLGKRVSYNFLAEAPDAKNLSHSSIPTLKFSGEEKGVQRAGHLNPSVSLLLLECCIRYLLLLNSFLKFVDILSVRGFMTACSGLDFGKTNFDSGHAGAWALPSCEVLWGTSSSISFNSCQNLS